MKALAKYHVSNHWIIGDKTFKNILIGPDNLPGLSRNGSQVPWLFNEFVRQEIENLTCPVPNVFNLFYSFVVPSLNKI